MNITKEGEDIIKSLEQKSKVKDHTSKEDLEAALRTEDSVIEKLFDKEIAEEPWQPCPPQPINSLYRVDNH